MFDIYCLIGIACDAAIINKSWWFFLVYFFCHLRLCSYFVFLFIFFFLWCRSFTQFSASTMAAATWSACPPPAPAWTCSSCRSSVTRTWWGTNCCTPLSPPLGSSSAEERRKRVLTARTKEKGAQRLHWGLCVWVSAGWNQSTERGESGTIEGRVGSFYHALKRLSFSEQKHRKYQSKNSNCSSSCFFSSPKILWHSY